MGGLSSVSEFSSEVETGSREENASDYQSGALFRFYRNATGPRLRVAVRLSVSPDDGNANWP
jgi:hypothetical protein